GREVEPGLLGLALERAHARRLALVAVLDRVGGLLAEARAALVAREGELAGRAVDLARDGDRAGAARLGDAARHPVVDTLRAATERTADLSARRVADVAGCGRHVHRAALQLADPRRLPGGRGSRVARRGRPGAIAAVFPGDSAHRLPSYDRRWPRFPGKRC